jgi:hypothetical protein
MRIFTPRSSIGCWMLDVGCWMFPDPQASTNNIQHPTSNIEHPMPAAPHAVGRKSLSAARVGTFSAGSNPERMRSLSPGLRAARYPGRMPAPASFIGCWMLDVGCWMFPGFMGRVESLIPLAALNPTPTVHRTQAMMQPLQGWDVFSAQTPRVAPGAQPWAECCNPFGIGSWSVSRLESLVYDLNAVCNDPRS